MKNNWQKVYPTVWRRAEKILKNDGVVVLPTDTLYGIVGKAKSKKVVERIYKIKERKKNKPFIVLITSYKDLDLFGVKINTEQAKIFPKFWPGKVSVILPCLLKKFEYLHRGTKSIAFRMIGSRNKNLFNLINKIGPLVAPSANTEGGKSAETIKEVKDYFGDEVSLYINNGKKNAKPSTLVRLEDNNWVVLRQGAKEIK